MYFVKWLVATLVAFTVSEALAKHNEVELADDYKEKI